MGWGCEVSINRFQIAWDEALAATERALKSIRVAMDEAETLSDNHAACNAQTEAADLLNRMREHEVQMDGCDDGRWDHRAGLVRAVNSGMRVV